MGVYSPNNVGDILPTLSLICSCDLNQQDVKFGTVTQFGLRDCLVRYRDLKKSKMPAAGILTS